MAKISGKIYIIVGLAVILLSYFVNLTRENKSFTVFMIVGGIFILIGIVREIWDSRKSVHSHETHLHHGTHNPRATPHKKAMLHHSHNTIRHKETEYCRHCGTVVRHIDNFCANCGVRVR